MKEYLSNLIYLRDYHGISAFLDIAILPAQEACESFRTVAVAIHTRIKEEPHNYLQLTTELAEHKNFFIGKLIRECAAKYKQQTQ